MIKYLLIVIYIYSGCLYAKWGAQELLSANRVDISDPGYVSTAKANCWGRNLKKVEPDHDFFRESYSSVYTKKEMEYDVYIPKNVEGNVEVVHFFPGIFSDTDSGYLKLFIEAIVNSNAIAIVYPNPLSKQYFESVPRMISAGNLEEEAKFFVDLSQFAELELFKKHQKLKKEKSRFLGLSYGSFVATIVAAKLIERKAMSIDEVVLFSPPVNMKKTIASIDDKLAELENKFTHWPILVDGWNMWRVCRYDLKKPEKLHETAKRKVLHLGFLESLSQSLVTFMRNRGEWKFWWHPFRLMTNNYFEWKKTLSFKKVINDFKLTSTKIFLSSKRASLNYWTHYIEQNSPHTRIKIYSAKDDFLNRPNSWDKFKSKTGSLILKEKGGHLGFMDKPEFHDFLGQIYQ